MCEGEVDLKPMEHSRMAKETYEVNTTHLCVIIEKLYCFSRHKYMRVDDMAGS